MPVYFLYTLHIEFVFGFCCLEFGNGNFYLDITVELGIVYDHRFKLEFSSWFSFDCKTENVRRNYE